MATTRTLAKFINELRYSDIPEDVVTKAKELALNSWGVQLAASTCPWSKLIYRYGRSQGGVPESTVVNFGMRTSASNAAFINGCFGHGFELDDNHGKAQLKGGCVTVPTALAIGETRLSSGKEFITAVVAGYEVMTRIALAARLGMDRAGTQATGTCGAFGAAAVTGKLLEFDEETMLQTLGNAGNQVVTWTYSPNSTGDRGNLKRTFGGMANSGGIRAALLAKEGLTGPDDTLDPGSGFARGFDVDAERAHMFTEGLGSRWEIMESHFKIYAQDGFIQPITEALERVRRARSFRTNEIDRIRLGVCSFANNIAIGRIREPADLCDAQWSANFSAALYLLKGGAGFAEYSDEKNLNDPEIRELSRRVLVEIDEDIEAEWRERRPRGAKVTIRLTDGTELNEWVHDLRIMSPEDLDNKFRELSSVVLDTKRSEQLLTLSRNLENVRDVSCLLPFLVR